MTTTEQAGAAEETKFAKYKIPPFSGKNYHKNSCITPGGTVPCAICGKPIKDGMAKHHAVVTGGGASWGDAKSVENDAGYMGMWPVGNDCHRKYVVKEGTN